MNTVTAVKRAALSLTIIGVLTYGAYQLRPEPAIPTTSGGVDAGHIAAPAPQKTLEQFTETLLETCGARLSEVRKKVTVDQVIRITRATFQRRDQQESFLFLLCIESKFDNSVRSRVGAVGFTQVMPKYADAFAQKCGLGKLGKDDLNDSEINLTIGACLFADLLNKFDGNVALALSGYNAGPESSTTKKLARLQGGAQETSEYLAKYLVLQEKMK